MFTLIISKIVKLVNNSVKQRPICCYLLKIPERKPIHKLLISISCCRKFDKI